MNLASSLEGMSARQRERRMLELIGMMAREEIDPSTVESEADLRQLAYLAALSRNRVHKGQEGLTRFLRQAMVLLEGADLPAGLMAEDPLQARFGARWAMDPGKVRSEGELYIWR